MDYSPISDVDEDKDNELQWSHIADEDWLLCSAAGHHFKEMTELLEQAEVLRREAATMDETIRNTVIDPENENAIINLLDQYGISFELSERARELTDQANQLHIHMFGKERTVSNIFYIFHYGLINKIVIV